MCAISLINDSDSLETLAGLCDFFFALTAIWRTERSFEVNYTTYESHASCGRAEKLEIWTLRNVHRIGSRKPFAAKFVANESELFIVSSFSTKTLFLCYINSRLFLTWKRKFNFEFVIFVFSMKATMGNIKWLLSDFMLVLMIHFHFMSPSDVKRSSKWWKVDGDKSVFFVHVWIQLKDVNTNCPPLTSFTSVTPT